MIVNKDEYLGKLTVGHVYVGMGYKIVRCGYGDSI